MSKTTAVTQKRWSLADLYPSANGKEFEKDFKGVEKLTTEFEKFRPILKEEISETDFMTIVKALESIYRLAQRMGGYANLWFAEDTQNQAALGLMAKLEQAQAELANRALFFSLWWKDLSDASADRLMKNSGDYHYWLEEMRHFKPHTLTEPEEKIINTKNVTGVNALNTLYDSMTNRYVFKVEVEGEVKEMTRGELMSLVRTTDPDLRARAYQELYRVYGADGDILGQMYQTIVRDWRNEEVTLRHHKSPISARNLGNDHSPSRPALPRRHLRAFSPSTAWLCSLSRPFFPCPRP